MDDVLIAFVKDRLNDDEAIAKRAGSDNDTRWEYSATSWGAWRVQTVADEQGRSTPITLDSEGLSDSVDEDAGPHIARHDPARVLHDVAAKRSLLGLLAADLRDPANAMRRMWAAEILRSLASSYADHPDFRQAWTVGTDAHLRSFL